jgi:cysteine-rich repeat protein
MSFNNLTICYFNYRYRTCPVSYPLFNEANNMCYDTCGPYNYENTTQGTCLPCLYNCYTCSNITTIICLSCNSTVDHRVISGTNCLCDLGYYDTGATVCASCNYSCATCTVGTACTSCTTTRTLASGQCQCNDGYAVTGASICVSCSILILGCLNCTSPTACMACDVVHNFVLSSYGNCECSYGNYLNSSASECLPFCSDGITIAPQEECDDGNLIAGDGCSP